MSKFYEKSEVNRDTIKQEIYTKLTTSKNTEELQKSIGDLLGKIKRAKLTDNIANEIETVKQNLLLKSRDLQMQSSCLPFIEKASDKNMSLITKILTDTIDPICQNLASIKNKYDYLDNFYSLEPKSNIVTDVDDIRMIISWLPNPENKRIKLTLLYRSSRDGLNGTAFNTKAQAHKPTVGLLDIKTEKICGGFLDQEWAPNRSKLSRNSFIFSITNKEVYPIKDQRGPIYPQSSQVMNYGCGALIAFDAYSGGGSSAAFTSSVCDCDCKGKTAQDLTGAAIFVPRECELYHVEYI